MEKIILEYECGDGFTYNCTETQAFEYSSVEDFKNDFMSACFEAVENKSYNFKFMNNEYYILHFGYLVKEGKISTFDYYEPEISNLEDWFQKMKRRYE